MAKQRTSGTGHEKPETSLDDLFAGNRRDRPKAKMQGHVFAVRQVRGPKSHDDLIIRATDPVDAHRQFFNFHGLANSAYRYNLRVVKIPDGDPRANKAIECQHPQTPGAATVDDLMQQHEEEVASQIGGKELQTA
jgi:hypothetical protein